MIWKLSPLKCFWIRFILRFEYKVQDREVQGRHHLVVLLTAMRLLLWHFAHNGLHRTVDHWSDSCYLDILHTEIGNIYHCFYHNTIVWNSLYTDLLFSVTDIDLENDNVMKQYFFNSFMNFQLPCALEHCCSHSCFESKRLSLPSQPLYMNCLHIPSCPS